MSFEPIDTGMGYPGEGGQMTMIEKVARAIEAAGPGYTTGEWQIFISDAEGALEALRDPTPDMLDAGNDALRRSPENLHSAWQAMIDAALDPPAPMQEQR